MKVWVVNNEDCSGVFSTKEKALSAMREFADDCEWKEVEFIDYDFSVRITYAVRNHLTNEWNIYVVSACEEEIDEKLI